MDNDWQRFLAGLNDYDRAIAIEVMRHVAAELSAVNARSAGNSERVTEAHLRIDTLSDRVSEIEDTHTLDEMQLALMRMALDLEAIRDRQADDVTR